MNSFGTKLSKIRLKLPTGSPQWRSLGPKRKKVPMALYMLKLRQRLTIHPIAKAFHQELQAANASGKGSESHAPTLPS